MSCDYRRWRHVRTESPGRWRSLAKSRKGGPTSPSFPLIDGYHGYPAAHTINNATTRLAGRAELISCWKSVSADISALTLRLCLNAPSPWRRDLHLDKGSRQTSGSTAALPLAARLRPLRYNVSTTGCRRQNKVLFGQAETRSPAGVLSPTAGAHI